MADEPNKAFHQPRPHLGGKVDKAMKMDAQTKVTSAKVASVRLVLLSWASEEQ
jgi:hypothetical protein